MGLLPQTSPLWTPKNPETTPISKYRHHVNKKLGKNFKSAQEVQAWSVTKAGRQDFWLDLWNYVGMRPRLPSTVKEAYDNNATIDQNPEWFRGVEMNYAENVLEGRDLHQIALIGIREGESLDGEKWTWRQLRENVRKSRSALQQLGVVQGECVAAMMSNSNWTIALFLACASIGVVFTSISPDMGLEGCVSRLKQVQPVIVFADSCQTYKGKKKSLRQKIRETIEAVPDPKPKVFLIPLGGMGETLDYPVLSDFLSYSKQDDALEYTKLPFSSPLIILYSSGTSGQAPKCIVHQHGIIIQLKKIAKLHNSLTNKDIVFQYSSTSWVLWNITNGHLSVGATVICYDGSPLYPDAGAMLQVLERHNCTYFGTSPRYLLELEMSGIKPANFDLKTLRMVTTTGATLTAEQFHWFYKAFRNDIHLSSVAGGTEICTSWMASDPSAPVYAAEMQIPALGQDVDVADTETGETIKHTGEAGELVCRSPFPSMPIYFYGDTDGAKYKEAYFERFENVKVWAQHDWIQFNPRTGGAQIHGRSDGTLNPSGIRFGSSEIYNVVESPRFNTRIADTLCVGRKREHDNDETVFLFVKMKDGHAFTDKLKAEVNDAIRTLLSPRHVPRFMFQVQDMPYTINGKKVEIVIKKMLSGKDVQVSSTVANPECLREYRQYRDVEHVRTSKL